MEAPASSDPDVVVLTKASSGRLSKTVPEILNTVAGRKKAELLVQAVEAWLCGTGGRDLTAAALRELWEVGHTA